MLVATAHEQLKLPSANDECVEYHYKDCVIRVERRHVGWRAAIYPKGSPFALLGGTYSPEGAGREAVVEQAKAIIDKSSTNALTSHVQAPVQAPAPDVSRRRLTATAREFFVRLQNYLGRGWTVVKNVYFSVARPPHRN